MLYLSSINYCVSNHLNWCVNHRPSNSFVEKLAKMCISLKIAKTKFKDMVKDKTNCYNNFKLIRNNNRVHG